jgi:hypothetical protein
MGRCHQEGDVCYSEKRSGATLYRRTVLLTENGDDAFGEQRQESRIHFSDESSRFFGAETSHVLLHYPFRAAEPGD